MDNTARIIVPDTGEHKHETVNARLRAIVGDAIEAANGDREEARPVVEREVADLAARDPEIMAEVIREWSRVAVGDYVRKGRQAAASGATYMNPALRRGLLACAKRDAARWLDDYWTEGGKRLGDCNKDDLLAEMELYRQRTRDNATKARLMGLLADRLGAKTVREKYSTEQIDRLWKRAQQE